MERGERIGHYEILGPLGAGGMGEVHLARDLRLGRKVALKCLPTRWVETPEVMRRFEREARLAAALNHPHIVTLYSVEAEGDVRFLTMELVEGETLADVIAAGGMDVPRFLHIAVPLASAVAAAHRQGIAHRDLKPRNIMVTTDGRVKVLDFGIARRGGTGGEESLEDATTAMHTAGGQVLGTAPYMSPEQARGQRVDTRTDLFSLGVVFHEMLTGTLPFRGTNLAEVLAAILRDAPPALRSLRPDVPVGLEAVVARCLQKRPEARYADTADLVRDLQDLGQEVAHGRFGPRTAAPVAAPARTLAVAEFVNISRDATMDWLGAGIAETVATDLRKLRSLAVISRDTVLRTVRGAGGETLGPVDLGARLGVDWVVAGAFQSVGRTVRITAQCVDVKAGRVIDAAKIDGSLDDIFTLQDRIVQDLVRSLDVESTSPATPAVAAVTAPAPVARGLEAFECFARARDLIDRMTTESFEQARAYLERAVVLAPDYALAHSGLGQLRAMTFIATTSTQDLEAAITHLQRAVELDRALADAHAMLAYCYTRAGRLAEAVAAGETAVRLEVQNWRAWYFLGVALLVQSAVQFRPELLDAAAEKFAASFRLMPDYQAAAQLLGYVRLMQGDYARARLALEQAAAIEGTATGGVLRFVGAHCLLGQLAAREGDLERALGYYEQSLALVQPGGHVYAAPIRAASHRGRGAVFLRQGLYVDAVSENRRGIEIVHESPRALGQGWIAVRLYLGLAMSFQRLQMRHEEAQCFEEATDLVRHRQRFDFSYIWDAAEADVHLDLATYLTLAGRVDEAAGCLRQALECGWSDPHFLDRDPMLEDLRRQPQYAPLRAKLGGRWR